VFKMFRARNKRSRLATRHTPDFTARREQKGHISAQCQRTGIAYIQGHTLGIGQGVAPRHLLQTGQPRAHAQVMRLLHPVERQRHRGNGARAHKAHLAAQHADQLRQLVQTGSTQEVPQRGHAGITTYLARGTAPWKAVAHCSNFPACERRTATPHTRVCIKPLPRLKP
jgi:hypothetical protein